jgi:hypothetical protein
MNRVGLALCLGCAAVAATGCRDLSSFSTHGDSFAGPVLAANFVLAGVDTSTSLCLTLDTDHLQDAPGTVSTSDGHLQTVPLRPIPQIWQDPLSTLSFGDGRLKNLVYVVTPTTQFADGNVGDVLAVVSLMQSGDVEVRLMRGAPGAHGASDAAAGDGGTNGAAASNLFAVFTLARQSGPCSY